MTGGTVQSTVQSVNITGVSTVIISSGDITATITGDPQVSAGQYDGSGNLLVNCASGCGGGGGGVTASSTFTLVNTATVTFNGVSQPVTVGNFPASQTVAGSVSVSNFPGSQPVTFSNQSVLLASTSVKIDGSSNTVQVSNFPATQPVSGSVQMTQSTAAVTNVSGQNLNVNIAAGSIGNTGFNVNNTPNVTFPSAQPVTSTYTVVSATYPVQVQVVQSTFSAQQNGTYTVTPGTGTWPVSTVNTTTVTFNGSAQPVMYSIVASTSAGWTSSTASNTTMSMHVSSFSAMAFTINVVGTVTGGVVTFECSNDGGVTWYNLRALDESGGLTRVTRTLTTSLSSMFQAPLDGYTDVRLRLSTVISGSGTMQSTMTVTATPSSSIVAPVSFNGGTNLVGLNDGTNSASITAAGALKVDGSAVNQPITTADSLVKGVQSSTGATVQELKDAGRTYVVLVATGVAGVTTEALFSFQQNKGGAVTPAVTSYTITSGKTLRIQSVCLSNRDGATTTSWSRGVLRSNTGGATTATSSIVWGLEAGGAGALAGSTGAACTQFPDGLEIAGNGTVSIGVSHLDQATTNLVSFSLTGYEY